MVSIKSKREIDLMSEACKITAKTYDMLEKNIKPVIVIGLIADF